MSEILCQCCGNPGGRCARCGALHNPLGEDMRCEACPPLVPTPIRYLCRRGCDLTFCSWAALESHERDCALVREIARRHGRSADEILKELVRERTLRERLGLPPLPKEARS